MKTSRQRTILPFTPSFILSWCICMQSIMVNFGQQYVETSVLSDLVVLFEHPFLLTIAVVYQVFFKYILYFPVLHGSSILKYFVFYVVEMRIWSIFLISHERKSSSRSKIAIGATASRNVGNLSCR